MRKIQLCVALGLLLSTASCKKAAQLEGVNAANPGEKATEIPAQNANTPLPITYTATGKFYTLGTKIIDPNGKEFVPRGINTVGYNSFWPGSTVNYLDHFVNKWKFNTIRLSCKFDYRAAAGPNIAANDIDAIVNAYTAQNIVVIIDDHIIGGINNATTQPAAVSKFTSLANAYKNNPYVWFNIYNEPNGDQNTYLTQAGQLVDAIRGTGATNIVMVAGLYWGQDGGNSSSCTNVTTASSFILSKGPTLLASRSNIIFDIHMYNQWNNCQTKLENFIERVHALNLPLIIGEYADYNGEATDPPADDAADFMLNLAPARNIGRIVWAWYGGDANDLTTSGNGGGQNSVYNGSGFCTNLSALGLKTWNDNRLPNNAIANAEFDTGINTWSVYNYTGASGTLSQVTGQGLSGANAAKVTITSGSEGTADWHITLHTNIGVTSGKTYNISFIAKAAAGRPIKFGVQGSSITHYTKSVTLSTTATTYTGTFTASATDASAALKFYLGGNGVDPFIDKIVVTEQ